MERTAGIQAAVSQVARARQGFLITIKLDTPWVADREARGYDSDIMRRSVLGTTMIIKDYFETDYFYRDNRVNKSLTADFSFEVNITNSESGAIQSIPILQKLNFDFEAGVIYSYFYIAEFQPVHVMTDLCHWPVDTFVQNPLCTAPPALRYDISIRKNEADRFQSNKRLIDTRYMVIYCAADLSDELKEDIYRYGDSKGMYIKMRDNRYAQAQSLQEKPLAFISHDSRDKELIARPLAQELTRILGRVWFDEYSLRIGDSLRDSIERGLKECKRCILILTPNFISNTGWTKTEFDSIFTRELIEGNNVVIPVWAGVTAKEVYEYSPSLANRLAADWNLGCEAVSEKIRDVIL